MPRRTSTLRKKHRRSLKTRKHRGSALNRVPGPFRQRPIQYEANRAIAARNGYGMLRRNQMMQNVPNVPADINNLPTVSLPFNPRIDFDRPVLVLNRENERGFNTVYQNQQNVARIRNTRINPRTQAPILRPAVWKRPVVRQ